MASRRTGGPLRFSVERPIIGTSGSRDEGAAGKVVGSGLRTRVIKQTKDLRYRDAEPLWFLGVGLTYDDAVCTGKRVVSWINIRNFYLVS
jgi:hypothetical protein